LLLELAENMGQPHQPIMKIVPCLLVMSSTLFSQELPNPFAVLGNEISAETWTQKGRKATLEIFSREVYGVTPRTGISVQWNLERESEVFSGQAARREYLLTLGGSLKARVLVYVPKGKGTVPAFVGLNFGGNHTVEDDPWITQSSKDARGKAASDWSPQMIIEKGFALATIHCADFDPDEDDGFKNGAHALFPDERNESSWGTIGAWAWGLSRVLDQLDSVAEIDAKRVVVIGHSRLGKTALWAGARDERFAMVISNNSGCGGAALSKRKHGETVAKITKTFPHWFCINFSKYGDREEALPVDQHQLIACIAPRPVYVASASKDDWADPKGEFLALKAAAPVYALFDKDPFQASEMPVANKAVGRKMMRYHLREGKHALTPWDWERYLAAASELLK
jgi:hypothetical protein